MHVAFKNGKMLFFSPIFWAYHLRQMVAQDEGLLQGQQLHVFS